MSSTSSRSTRRSTRGAARDASGDPQSTDMFRERTTDQSGSTIVRDEEETSGQPLRQNIEESELEPRSGLRTSEVEPSSALSYSEISSADALSSVRNRVEETRSFVDETSSGGPQTVIWGTDVNVAQVMERFKQFIMTFTTTNVEDEGLLHTGVPIDPTKPLYLQRLEDLAYSGHGRLEVNCQHLLEFSRALYLQMVTYPKEVIPACDAAAHQLYIQRCREMRLEAPIQIRPFNCERSRALRQLNPEDLDQLVSVTGLVIRCSSLIPEMMKAVFKCSVCDQLKSCPCERGRVVEPDTCDHCHAANTYQLQHNRSLFFDKQMIKLQESPEDMPAGQTPHTIVLYAHDDLVDSVQPGDRVTVTGIFRAASIRPNPRMRTLNAVHKTYVDALHFRLQISDRLRLDNEADNISQERIAEIEALSRKPDLYERLSSAIAPSIYENEDIKKGILLQLFGGTRKDLSELGRGTFRSEINILLCGDPGTSKSQLLQYVFNLIPRGQYTSGKGSSAVGLTAYVTKDPETKQFTLQTGALVLSDNGVCCIDEFDKMSESARSVLHEVMEQQTLSIAKAGIICQLNARTSVLAAANPVMSKWDPKKTIIDNIQLPHTLLSRFDLIFLMLDPQDEVYDTRLARHLVSLYYKDQSNLQNAPFQEQFVDMRLLRDYISYAKSRVNPILNEEAGQYLVEEYVEMRKLGSGRGQVSAYPRQLESLIRLAEAHARLRLADYVTVQDCREARRLQKEALKQTAVDPATGFIDVSILTTGVSSSMRKRKEEIGKVIWDLLSEKGQVVTFTYQRTLEEIRTRSERIITREMFEDGLNYLKNENKIDWAGNTIRKR